MELLRASWFRGSFVPMAPDEPTHVFAARMREREKRVPFRRWRPVWQVQVSDVDVNGLLFYSSLARRSTAIKRAEALPGITQLRVVDVGTGEVAYLRGGA